ncbi:DUF192 domain-containing protein [Haloarculaceae archaeon H-GB2-1]|nr:DUF192 domain-containing protein [Haloarculaceae archaeon H-GB1-1]MEA5388354.1 DUF192 domain-containing protein [Haloarculaceae archaeon H-GB11]MEA5406391.1 DUF192 domain-containing protein [Haloarculaceae archaeon H-GB2-1]
MSERRTAGILLVLVLVTGGVLAAESGLAVQFLGTGSYEEATVTVSDENGTELGSVEVTIANTSTKRYVGLSRNDALAWDRGMLFVHEEEDEFGYVMRNMSFPLDIVFVDANGTITEIYHAPTPDEEASESDLDVYRGRAKWVLEVNRGWTNETGVEVGDTVAVPPAAR